MSSMGTAFVTGGSGFLGRALVDALVARGHRVRALARSDASANAVLSRGAEPVRGDLEDEAAMAAGMQGCARVFHCAAYVKDHGRLKDVRRINVEGTQAVLRAAVAAGVQTVVHVSTEAVLVGGGPIRNADESRPLPVKPLGAYAITKGEAERAVVQAAKDGLHTVIVRPRFIWGRGDTSVLPEFVSAVKEGRYAWIGGGAYLTSTCHVRNVVEGMLLAAEKGQAGQAYFLTDGQPVVFREFLTTMLHGAGVEPPQRSLPRGVAMAAAAVCDGVWGGLGLRSRPPLTRLALSLMGGEVTVNDARARRELGYQSHVTVAEGLAEMAQG